MPRHSTIVLRPEATRAEVRLRAIKAQLNAGVILCRLAEHDIGLHRIDEAHSLIERLRLTVESVRRHLEEPHHVPPSSLADVRAELAQLESRVLAVKAQLHQSS